MGLTGELVKSVFSRSRSTAHDSNSYQGRHTGMEKKRWSSVRSYLCGDEFNSVLAEEDSASVKSSEATVTQPLPVDFTEKESGEDEEKKEALPMKRNHSISTLFHEEDAAMVIQSAFRQFLVRRREDREQRSAGEKNVLVLDTGSGSPSRESIGTSIEVQTAHSVKAFSVKDETLVSSHRAQQRARTQVLKLKEDWDDSTVSSNVSKMRIQHRFEAMTRRERALAYAFSQQLRICSKKRQAQSDGGTEADVGWSWLERWMATRVPDKYMDAKQHEPTCNSRTLMVKKRVLELAGEEKESCGSNEVSVHLDSVSLAVPDEGENLKPNKSTTGTNKRNVSRRKSVTKRQCQKVHAQISKKDSIMEVGSDKRHKQTQLESKDENICNGPES